MKTEITKIGTDHFASRLAAIRYYEVYGIEENEVIEKIANKEITIGEPTGLQPNAVAKLDKDRRYYLEITEQVPEKPKAQSAIYYLGHTFDTLEVHTVVSINGDLEALSHGDEIPEQGVYCYSLYGHLPNHGVDCIGDFKTFEDACEIAVNLGGREQEPIVNGFTKDKFVGYLENTLIPDLKESGMDATAEDFETAVKFIR